MSSKLKILCIERGFACCSHSSGSRGQIEKLRNNYDIRIIDINHYFINKSFLNIVEESYIKQVRVPFVPKFERLKSYFYIKGALNATNEIYKEFKFDIVHSHFAYIEGLCAKVTAEKFKKPLVITARGDDLLIYPSNKYIKKMVAEVLLYASKVICVSDCLVKKVREFGISNEKIIQISDGVPEEIFNTYGDKKELRLKLNLKTKYVILFVGNIITAKGIFVLLKAFSLICNRYDVSLVMIGDGSDYKKLLKQIKDMGLIQKIILPGYLNSHLVAEYMKSSDFLVLPSFSESFGNVLVEALFCGIPIIGSKLGGIPEIIDKKDFGILVEENNYEKLSYSIECMLNNLDSFSKANITTLINKKYLLSETVKKVSDVYNDLIK